MALIPYLQSLGATHLFTLNNEGGDISDDLGDSVDPTRITNAVGSTYTFVTDPVCEGFTHSLDVVEDTGSTTVDGAVFDNRNDINGGNGSGNDSSSFDYVSNNRTLMLWFKQAKIENPTCIYEQGGAVNNFAFMGGALTTFQAADQGQPFLIVQSQSISKPNRPYFLVGVWEHHSEHAGSGNRVLFYMNGVLQGISELTGTDNFPAHSGDIVVGNSSDSLQSFSGTTYDSQTSDKNCNLLGMFNNVSLTAEQCREIFERTTFTDDVIAADTVENQQAALDLLSGNVYDNSNCAIRIFQATDATDYRLFVDNIDFDADDTIQDISIQWMGEGVLTLENTNGTVIKYTSTPVEIETTSGVLSGGGGSIVQVDNVVRYTSNTSISDVIASKLVFDGTTTAMTISGGNIPTFENVSGNSVTARLKSGAALPTTLIETDGSITVIPAGPTITFNDLTSSNVQILDDNDIVFDRQVNIDGSYSIDIPDGSIGTWRYCVNREGYFPVVGTFTPANGIDVAVNSSLAQKLQPDGAVMYSGSSSGVLSVVPEANGSRMNIRVGDGSVGSQVVFDEVEDALQTEEGMSYLMKGGGEVSFANLPTGIFIFMGTNVRLIRDDVGDDNATVNAFVQSTDGIVIDNSNGSILFVTVTDADKVSAHQGAVWIKTDSGNSGTTFPTGTPGKPVDNLADAIQIAKDLALVELKMESTVTLDEDVSGFRISPGGGTQTLILDISGNHQGTVIEEFFVTGQQVGSVLMRDCSLNNLSGIQGTYRNVGFGNNFSVDPSAIRCNMFDCYSIVAGNTKPECDIAGTDGLGMNVRGWSGGFQLNNCTSPNNNVSIDVVSASVKIDSSCTEGDIVVRGVGVPLVDESGPNCSVVSGLITSTLIETAATEGISGFYSDLSNGLSTLNNGIKKASLGIPHNTDI
jgi:hypothetical protein